MGGTEEGSEDRPGTGQFEGVHITFTIVNQQSMRPAHGLLLSGRPHSGGQGERPHECMMRFAARPPLTRPGGQRHAAEAGGDKSSSFPSCAWRRKHSLEGRSPSSPDQEAGG